MVQCQCFAAERHTLNTEFCVQRAKQPIYVRILLIYKVDQRYPQEGRLRGMFLRPLRYLWRKMGQRIIFLDVDGTLVDYEGRLPDSAARAQMDTACISAPAAAAQRSILSGRKLDWMA